MTADNRPIHAVPFEAAKFSHRADRRCHCGPLAMVDINVPSRVVWRHRIPPAPPVKPLPDGLE